MSLLLFYCIYVTVVLSEHVSVVWSDQRWDLNTLYQWLTLKTGESFFFPLTRPESQKYVRISHLNNELEIDTTLIGSHEQRPIPHSSNSFLTQSVIKSSKSWKSRQCLAPCYSLLMRKKICLWQKRLFIGRWIRILTSYIFIWATVELASKEEEFKNWRIQQK